MMIPTAQRYIPPTTAGVMHTLEAMTSMAKQGGRLVTQVAGQLVQRAGGRQSFPTVLYSWLASNWREEADPYGVEWVRSPEVQLERAATRGGQLVGDCDDVATLAAGLGLAAGFRARYCAIASGPSRVPSHTYAELVDPQTGTVWGMDILDHGAPKADATMRVCVNV